MANVAILEAAAFHAHILHAQPTFRKICHLAVQHVQASAIVALPLGEANADP